MQISAARTYSVLGKTFTDTQAISVDSAAVLEKTVPAAVAAQLTTRTSDSIGVITLPAGHGIANGSKVDLYWGTSSLRTYADAAVVSNALTLSNGAGDVLPTNLTSITVAVVNVEPCAFDSADLQAIVAGGNVARSSFRFLDSADDSQALAVQAAAGRSYFWDTDQAANGFTNPFGDELINAVRFSHANTANSEVMRVVAGVAN